MFAAFFFILLHSLLLSMISALKNFIDYVDVHLLLNRQLIVRFNNMLLVLTCCLFVYLLSPLLPLLPLSCGVEFSSSSFHRKLKISQKSTEHLHFYCAVALFSPCTPLQLEPASSKWFFIVAGSKIVAKNYLSSRDHHRRLPNIYIHLTSSVGLEERQWRRRRWKTKRRRRR